MARVKDTGSAGVGVPAAGKKQDKKATKKLSVAALESDPKPELAKSSTKTKRKSLRPGIDPGASEDSWRSMSKPKQLQEDTQADPPTVGKGKVKKATTTASEAQNSEKSATGEVSSLGEAASAASNVAKNMVEKGKARIAAINERAEASYSKKGKKAVPQQSEEQTVKGASKKRKATEEDVSTIEVAPRPDSSSGAGSAKKQKKSAKSGSSSAIKAVASKVESAANALVDGQTSIVEDVANLAKNAVESKPRTKKSAVKGKKDAKSAIEPTSAELEEGGVSLSAAGGQDQFENGDDEWEPEEEIAQLITGFESASEEEESGDEGFKPGSVVPKLPRTESLTAKERRGNSDKAGVIYIGRIPHGFHEHEMRAYFSQFGDINHVRLSRSKKTGRSKHYAFLEFKSEEVAKIAAKTMDKYLLFGHILRCSFVPQEQVHPSLWKGADKRFKTVPWARIEGRKLTVPKGRTQWQKKVDKETQRRADKATKLKEIGYEYEPTKLTSVDSVPVQASKHIENGALEEKTIVVGKDGNSVIVSEEVKTKKTKKSKALPKTSESVAETTEAQPSSTDGKRIKKPSKRALEAAIDGPMLKKGRKMAAS